jgi:type VI secretion system protein ImpG
LQRKETSVENESLYKAFRDELSALERFRMQYVGEHPGTPLAPDDPDVRRLVEALAFFAARSRLSAVRTLLQQRRRLFRQFMPYLIEPLPAMGMLQAMPNGQLVEAVDLPRGTEMALRDSGDRVAIFRTLRALRLQPLSVGRLATLVLPDGRLRLALPITTTHRRNDDVGVLSFHVNYLNDFNASLRVLAALQKHLGRVAVSFDERVDEHTRGVECQVGFGSANDAHDAEDGQHPLARERAYFHFPRVEHFFDVTVPGPPANWQRFTLLFDLAADWPRHLRLTADVFQLFTTPIENLSRASAQPITHDGTEERWPLRHPQGARYELHSVRGVYRLAGDALVPLPPATIAGGAGAWELDDEPREDGERKPALLVHLPEALRVPTMLSVEAEWLQPWFSSAIGQRLEIAPHRRGVPGVSWELSGEMVPHLESALGRDVDDFTPVMVLSHKRMLDRADLDLLLDTLRSVWSGPFAALRPLLRDVTAREATATSGGRVVGSKLIYELRLADHELGPLEERFIAHVEDVLSAWSSGAAVEVRLASQP